MKKFFILVLGMIMLMLIPINVKADDEVEIGVDQEESNIEYVEIDQEMESFSVGHKVSLSINPNVEKRVGSYKLKANQYVTLKISYSIRFVLSKVRFLQLTKILFAYLTES